MIHPNENKMRRGPVEDKAPKHYCFICTRWTGERITGKTKTVNCKHCGHIEHLKGAADPDEEKAKVYYCLQCTQTHPFIADTVRRVLCCPNCGHSYRNVAELEQMRVS